MDEHGTAKGLLLLEYYETEREKEKLRDQCESIIEMLNGIRDWLRAAHGEYSGFADKSHLDSRFFALDANIKERAAEYRESLDLDRMLRLVQTIREQGAKLASLAEKRKAAGIP